MNRTEPYPREGAVTDVINYTIIRLWWGVYRRLGRGVSGGSVGRQAVYLEKMHNIYVV